MNSGGDSPGRYNVRGRQGGSGKSNRRPRPPMFRFRPPDFLIPLRAVICSRRTKAFQPEGNGVEPPGESFSRRSQASSDSSTSRLRSGSTDSYRLRNFDFSGRCPPRPSKSRHRGALRRTPPSGIVADVSGRSVPWEFGRPLPSARPSVPRRRPRRCFRRAADGGECLTVPCLFAPGFDGATPVAHGKGLRHQ